jgi:hypothetical protein
MRKAVEEQILIFYTAARALTVWGFRSSIMDKMSVVLSMDFNSIYYWQLGIGRLAFFGVFSGISVFMV